MLCPFCKQKTLELIEGVFPYTEDHFQCNNCDITYAYEEVMVKIGRKKEKDNYDKQRPDMGCT